MNFKPILYAEDEENDAFFMQRAFKQAGIENKLIVVADGRQAVDYLSNEGEYANRNLNPLPCLVLLDLNMPRLSGVDVLKWMRAQPFLSGLPVLVVTSSNRDSDVHRAYLQGANGYLVKPSQPDDLVAMVKSIKEFWLTHNHGVVRRD